MGVYSLGQLYIFREGSAVVDFATWFQLPATDRTTLLLRNDLVPEEEISHTITLTDQTSSVCISNSRGSLNYVMQSHHL